MNKFKMIALNIAMCPTKVLLKLGKSQDVFGTYLNNLIHWLEKNSDFYLSYLQRAKTLDQLAFLENNHENEINKKTAIVMQGPIVKANNFTLETVKLYSLLYPGAKVIVSTWNNEDEAICAELGKLNNCELVTNKYPEHSGILNMNYQVVTTCAGIQHARELNCKYVIKTRTDCRFYKKDLLTYLKALLDEFPLKKGRDKQKYRIVAMGAIMDSMFRPYWLADQFNYGYIDDMEGYWNYPLKNIDMNKSDVFISLKNMTWNERTQNHLAAEPEFVINYIKKLTGIEPELSVKSYWEIVKNRFVVVSRPEIEFYWYKYSRRHDESASTGLYYTNDSSQSLLTYNWNFSTWLSLLYGYLKYEDRFEEIANKNRY